MSILFTILGILLTLAVLLFLVVFLIGSSYHHEDEIEIEIDAPVEVAFREFNDIENMPKWMDSPMMSFKSIENISGGDNEVGSTWKLVFEDKRRKKEIEMVETVTAFDENERFAFTLDDKMFDFDLDIRFREEDGKTYITEKLSGKGKNSFINGTLKLMKTKSHNEKIKMYHKLRDLIEDVHKKSV